MQLTSTLNPHLLCKSLTCILLEFCWNEEINSINFICSYPQADYSYRSMPLHTCNKWILNAHLFTNTYPNDRKFYWEHSLSHVTLNFSNLGTLIADNKSQVFVSEEESTNLPFWRRENCSQTPNHCNKLFASLQCPFICHKFDLKMLH